jgi:hypothetical protein
VAQVSSQTGETYNYPGPTASISAAPTGSALLWALDNSNYLDAGINSNLPIGAAILRAYAAGNLATTLYSSSTNAGDTAAGALKYTVPVVANGHVYVGGSHQLTVYGLAP